MLPHSTPPSSSTPADQSQSSPVFDLDIPKGSERKALQRLKFIIQEDFIDHEKLLTWWKLLDTDKSYKSYLDGLLEQIRSGRKLLQGPITVQNEYAANILALWQDARRLAKKDFFYDKLKRYHAEHPVPAATVPGVLKQSEEVKTERSLQTTEVKKTRSSSSFDPWDTVCWLHQDGSQIPYSDDARKIILEAYRKNEKEVMVAIENDTYTIDFDSFTQKSMKKDMVRPIFLGDRGIFREPFSQKAKGFSLETFTHSSPIEVKRDEQGYYDAPVAVRINPHDPQTWFIRSRTIPQSPYGVASQLVSFRQGLPAYEVDQVFVILNPPLFAKYSDFRKQSFEKNTETGDKVQEWTLFHGTPEENVTSISKNGFDVSRATRSHYGKGIYFARPQSISAQTDYSVPTEQNQQYIIAAKVVVGPCVVGNDKMDTPPPKPASGMVDRLPDWKILASPHKNQSYPAMVLVFSPKLPKATELKEVKEEREEEEIKHVTSDSDQPSKKRKEDRQGEGSRKKQSGQTSSSSTTSSSSSSSQTTTSGSTESLSASSSSAPSLEEEDVTDEELVIAFREAFQFSLERVSEDMEEWKKLGITDTAVCDFFEKFTNESKKVFPMIKSRTTLMRQSSSEIGKMLQLMDVVRKSSFFEYFEQKDSDKRLRESSVDKFKAFMDSIEKLTGQDEVQQESTLSAVSSSTVMAASTASSSSLTISVTSPPASFVFAPSCPPPTAAGYYMPYFSSYSPAPMLAPVSSSTMASSSSPATTTMPFAPVYSQSTAAGYPVPYFSPYPFSYQPMFTPYYSSPYFTTYPAPYFPLPGYPMPLPPSPSVSAPSSVSSSMVSVVVPVASSSASSISSGLSSLGMFASSASSTPLSSPAASSSGSSPSLSQQH